MPRRSAVPAVLLCLVLFLPNVLRAADEVSEAASFELFKSAFAPGVSARERVEILRRVPNEFPDTRYADDALWVLAEYAAKSGSPRAALKFRQDLIAKYPRCSLEKFTMQLEVYRKSRVPQVMRVIESTGHHVIRRKRYYFFFNPLPMVVHEDIAIALLHWRQPEEALKQFQEALAAGPPGGLYPEFLEERIQESKRRLSLPEDSSDGNDKAAKDKPDSEQDGDEPSAK